MFVFPNFKTPRRRRRPLHFIRRKTVLALLQHDEALFCKTMYCPYWFQFSMHKEMRETVRLGAYRSYCSTYSTTPGCFDKKCRRLVVWHPEKYSLALYSVPSLVEVGFLTLPKPRPNHPSCCNNRVVMVGCVTSGYIVVWAKFVSVYARSGLCLVSYAPDVSASENYEIESGAYNSTTIALLIGHSVLLLSLDLVPLHVVDLPDSVLQGFNPLCTGMALSETGRLILWIGARIHVFRVCDGIWEGAWRTRNEGERGPQRIWVITRQNEKDQNEELLACAGKKCVVFYLLSKSKLITQQEV